MFLTVSFSDNYNLKDCIEIGLKQKRSIKSADYLVESSQQSLRQSYSNILPSISLSTNANQTNYPERENISFDLSSAALDTIKTNKNNLLSAGIALNQIIYNGGQSRLEIQKSKIELEVSKLTGRNIRIRMILDIVSSFYSLLQNQKLLEVAEENLKLSNQQVNLTQKQFNIGLISKTDFLKATVLKGRAQVELLNQKTALNNSRRKLFNDMGVLDFGQAIVATSEEWTPIIVPSSSDALELLKTKNPKLQINQKQILISDILYKISTRLKRPSINGSLNYSANGTNSQELIDALKKDWSLSGNISLNMPFYSGNKISSKAKQFSILLARDKNDYISNLNNLRVEVELLRNLIKNYSDIIPINKSVVTSAKEDLRLIKKRYSLGSATILEVLDAQVSLMRSSSTLINSIHESRIQESNLKALLGILDLEYDNERDEK